ncbi:MAG: molybdopterin-dependent oxidoreductase [Coriobacteriia bacterium]|nr:molybdopterin-dependent oxidoreductase [Coriobacteriia bacterium]
MEHARRLHVISAACAGCFLIGALAFAGSGIAEEATASNQTDTTASTAQETWTSDDGTTYTYLNNPTAASGIALKNKAYSPDGPIVTELADGRFVQRTPSEDISANYSAEGAYSHPASNVLFNDAYLKADERGCNACHDDLGALLNSGGYGHTDLTNGMGIDVTVQMCIDCHTVGEGYQTSFYDFGTLIHGIHQDVADANCMSCHNVTEDGEGFTLWDVSKHSLMRGITNVSELDGDFSWNQTDVVPAEDLFNYSWYYRGSDYLRNERQANGDERDTSIYDTWTITMSGEVNKEVTYTLADLIANAPSVTKAVTMHCTLNPTNGPYIGNCVVTGIPLSWLIEQAGGLTDAAYGMYASSSDGNANSMLVENLEGKDALLVYEIDGEPLEWDEGFPCMLWVGGTGAPINAKELSDITFVDDSDEGVWEYLGWTTEDGEGYYNKPNVGLWGTPEGLCVQAGEPYTFKGYASAWDQPITALEFSMDGGETWSSWDTVDASVSQWVSWQYTWTPPEGVDTAYVLQVRARTADGAVTPEPVEVMVNAKSDLDAFAQQVRDAEGTVDGLADNQAVIPGNIGTNEGGPLEILDDPQGYAANLSDGTSTPNFALWTGAADATTGGTGDGSAAGDAAKTEGE